MINYFLSWCILWFKSWYTPSSTPWFSKEDIKVLCLCCLCVSNKHRTPTKHEIRIKPWYFRIQQNWVIFLQVYVTHFEYWFLSKFSHLTARQNKSRPGGEIFRNEREEIKYFFPLSGKTTGKLFSYEQPLTYHFYNLFTITNKSIFCNWNIILNLTIEYILATKWFNESLFL